MRKPVSDCPEAFLAALKSVGERIAHLRMCYGWTQKELSSVAGLSIHYIRAIEQFKMVDAWVQWRICDALRVRFAVLWINDVKWAKVAAVREQEVGWDAKTQKPRAKQGGTGVEIWE